MQTGNEERRSYEYRCLTPIEIASAVRNRRELLGLKQLTLAQRAGVSERTVQRLERGEKVEDLVLQEVAAALGLSPNSFLGARTISPPEEAERRISEFLDKFQFVEANPVADWRDFEALMGCAATVVDDGALDADAATTIVELRDYLGSSLDVSDLLNGRGRMEHAKAMYGLLEPLLSTGTVARFAIAVTEDDLKIGALILLPQGHERADVSLALFPKHFAGILGAGPTEDELRLANLFMDAARLGGRTTP